LEISGGLWQEISINIIRSLPQSKEKNAIVIIMDEFTKMIQLKATTITVLSQEITKFIETRSGSYMEYQERF